MLHLASFNQDIIKKCILVKGGSEGGKPVESLILQEITKCYRKTAGSPENNGLVDKLLGQFNAEIRKYISEVHMVERNTSISSLVKVILLDSYYTSFKRSFTKSIEKSGIVLVGKESDLFDWLLILVLAKSA